MERHFEKINVDNYFASHVRFEHWVDWLTENVGDQLSNSHHASSYEKAKAEYIEIRGFTPYDIERAYSIHVIKGQGWYVGLVCDSNFDGEMGFCVDDVMDGVTLRLMVD